MAKNNRENVNGIDTIYGPVVSDSTRGVSVAKGDVSGYIELKFDAAEDLDIAYGLSDADNKFGYGYIPANAKIVSAEVFVTEAFAGGTSIIVGLDSRNTGIAIDSDGLVNATDGAVAKLTAGAAVTGTGALVGTAIGSVEGILTVTGSGTFTAGKAKILVEYRVGGADV